MTKTKKLATPMIAIVLIMALVCGIFSNIIVANAATYNNVTCINRWTTNARKSGVILVGDSRTYGILTNNTNFAGCGNVGAHFWHGYNNSNQRYYSSYILGKFTTSNGTSYNGSLSKLQEQAQKTIQEVGYCHIWFFTTINDAQMGSYSDVANDMLTPAYKAQTWKAKYNGKTVYTKVHVVHLIPDKAKTIATSKFTNNINNYEDSKIDKYNKNITSGNTISKNGYAAIINGTASYNTTYKKTHPNAKFGYLSDGVHYTNDTYKVIGMWIKAVSTKY